MRFMHIADLHFGKSIYGMPLLEDQKHWAEQFLKACEIHKVQAVVIAGDVYDRSVPADDAVELLDWFVTQLAERGLPVMMVAGNHDSASKLSFARHVLSQQNIHIAGRLEKKLTQVTLSDEYGEVVFTLMPYLYPASVRRVLENEEIRDYETAARSILAEQTIDPSGRNVIIAHQNVTRGGEEIERTGSETAVGGVGGMDYSVFDDFDYAALGHIHAAMPVGRENVRYAGTPLFYHFSELRHKEKGALMVELGEKGQIRLTQIPIKPLHPMCEVKGAYDEVRAAIENAEKGTFFSIVLTDRRYDLDTSRALNALAAGCEVKLLNKESVFENGKRPGSDSDRESRRKLSEEELFGQFYRKMEGHEPSEADSRLFAEIGELARESYGDRNEPSEQAVDALLEFIMKQEAKL